MQVQGEREILYKGRKFDLERVSVLGRSGRCVEREVIRHPGAVCVIPVLEGDPQGGATDQEARLVLLRNLRPAVSESLIEFCAGTLDAGEAPESCAARELIEESGYRARRLHSVGWFYTTPGMTDERMHVFVAQALEHVGQRLEADEEIEVFDAPLSEVMRMIDSGDILDAKSMLGLLLAQRQGLIPQSSQVGPRP